MGEIFKWTHTPKCKECKHRDKRGKRCKIGYEKCPYNRKKT